MKNKSFNKLHGEIKSQIEAYDWLINRMGEEKDIYIFAYLISVLNDRLRVIFKSIPFEYTIEDE